MEVIFDTHQEFLPPRPGLLASTALLVELGLEVHAVCGALDCIEPVRRAALSADDIVERGALPLAFFLTAMLALRHGDVR